LESGEEQHQAKQNGNFEKITGVKGPIRKIKNP
jgi:hypothetical protein